MGLYALANPLHPDVFPSVRQMEAEIVRMCATVFNGDADSCGCVTSGGTESLLLAVKAYRDRYRAKHGHAAPTPEVVVGVSAHAAFDKAASYFNVDLVKVPVLLPSGKVDVDSVHRAMSSRTCLVVASAPSFPHGALDDVPRLARVAEKWGAGLHVDACLGRATHSLTHSLAAAAAAASTWPLTHCSRCRCCMCIHSPGHSPRGKVGDPSRRY
eukprot:GHVU01180236.1.p1 GENE.GHVU01180236.1~~GHVU01180236.1.p1  ORF type:complete len:213 (-),score=33.64 GHVU01180236.1:186-824(-)